MSHNIFEAGDAVVVQWTDDIQFTGVMTREIDWSHPMPYVEIRTGHNRFVVPLNQVIRRADELAED